MIEKVNPCHPDKVADRIAGALVDLAYKKERSPRIAVEVLIGHGACHIIAEASCSIIVDEVSPIVRRIAGDVDIYAFLKAQETGSDVELCCAIGDEAVDGRPYSEIVETAKQYIDSVGGFERFAEWGLF